VSGVRVVTAGRRRPARRRPAVFVGVVLCCAVLIAFAVVVQATSRGDDGPRAIAASARPQLDRASAVKTVVDLVVAAGAAGAHSDRALGAVQRRVYAATVDPGLEALTLRAAGQQRRALLRAAPVGASLLERTIPVGYQLTRFDAEGASVALWTLQVAGPDAGRRAPAAWWLTTRVDLVPEDGAWRVRRAVAVQGPTPRLVRAQQAGVGDVKALRGLLRTTRSLRHAP